MYYHGMTVRTRKREIASLGLTESCLLQKQHLRQQQQQQLVLNKQSSNQTFDKMSADQAKTNDKKSDKKSCRTANQAGDTAPFCAAYMVGETISV
mmetsp:Transcript_5054/g.12790  ORF Transcript_5054/g.12790 Transcript_5054/m.12790 type:complete len:95 (+) Transcript_5054:894-1178(+)